MSEGKNPSIWRVVELREIATFVSGGTPSRKNPDYFTGTIPWLTGYDLSEDRVTFIDDGREYITEEAINKSATNLVLPKTILLTTRVTVGKVAVAQRSLCFSQDVTGIIIDNNEIIDPVYVAHYLLAAREILLLRNRGTTIQGIIRRDLERFQIPLPPLSEQRRIVDILRQTDELRCLRCEVDELAQGLPAALLYETFLRDKEKLQDWRNIKLGKVAPFVTSGSRGWAKYYADSGGKFIRVQNVLEGELNFDDLAFVQVPEGPEKERSAIMPGDLLITITGTVGRVAVAPEDIGEAYVSQHVAIARLDGSISSKYVAAFLNHPLGGQLQIARQNYGQIKPGLNLAQIQSLRILRPPDDLIADFQNQANEGQKIRSDCNASAMMLDELFRSFLARAFTGELSTTWRERHAEDLTVEARQRDEALGLRVRVVPPVEPEVGLTALLLDETRPRYTILRELSAAQQQVYQAVLQTKGYFTAENLMPGSGLSPDTARRALTLLEALGLIARVRLPDAPTGGALFYIPAYRVSQATDNSLDDDLAALKAAYPELGA